MSDCLLFGEEIFSVLENDERIVAVYLHGSYARGESGKDSDVDLAVLPKSGCHFSDYERAVLAGELGIIMNKTVDIGEISSRNLVYSKEVFGHGTSVFSKDTLYERYMRMTLLSMYASFNEDRKEVIHAWTS